MEMMQGPSSLATAPVAGEDPTLERCFRGHKSTVSCVAFNPNMRQLVSGSLDCSLMVWNFKPQLRAFKFVGHQVTNTTHYAAWRLRA